MSQRRNSQGIGGDRRLSTLALTFRMGYRRNSLKCQLQFYLFILSQKHCEELQSAFHGCFCFQVEVGESCVISNHQRDIEGTEGHLDEDLLICFERRVEEVIRGREN